ncbi:homoserine dehydrogenase [Chloroflexota bacterium]
MKNSIGIGLIGMGTIGTGVARVLLEKKDDLAAQAGCPIVLHKIVDKDLVRKRSFDVNPALLSPDAADVLNNPDVDIVIELIGGENPAFDFIRQAIKNKKSVVTANKEVIAKHGPEILGLAMEHNRGIRYEASVGGGIPIIAPLLQNLSANSIRSVQGIINGTTNYILTRMADEGLEFATALKQAQDLGYAEADPTNDIEGYDAAYKLAIMATLAFHSTVHPENVYHEGISKLDWRDFRYAKELGYAIKLLAIGKEMNNAIEARVHPVFIPEDTLLAKVNGVFNAIQIEGDLVGDLIFYGRGAGASPTSSAVVSDVIELAKNIYSGIDNKPHFIPELKKSIKHIGQIETRYYLRMTVADSPGVLAKISRILGDHSISISAVIQKEADPVAQTAEIVIMTQHALEEGLNIASREMEKLDVVKEINNIIRVES